MTHICEFTSEELTHIKAALIIMRDIDLENSMGPEDDAYRGARLSTELISRFESMGV